MHCETIELWKKGTYLGEMEDGFKPILQTYILDGEKSRGAVLICPGGGYAITWPGEAEPVALKFNAAGYHAFVVHYSVAPRKHPQPLYDVSKAMSIIRENADKWKVDSNNIAVCGFSAGGHAAGSLAVHWDKDYISKALGIEKGMNKPNAAILCYPVITSGEFAHRDSFYNLLGREVDEKLLKEMSLELQVNEKTPPVFLWHTFSDDCVPVENSLLFAKAMKDHSIPFEFHIYNKGVHGMSTASDEMLNYSDTAEINPHVATWMELCIQWLDKVFE